MWRKPLTSFQYWCQTLVWSGLYQLTYWAVSSGVSGQKWGLQLFSVLVLPSIQVRGAAHMWGNKTNDCSVGPAGSFQHGVTPSNISANSLQINWSVISHAFCPQTGIFSQITQQRVKRWIRKNMWLSLILMPQLMTRVSYLPYNSFVPFWSVVSSVLS